MHTHAPYLFWGGIIAAVIFAILAYVITRLILKLMLLAIGVIALWAISFFAVDSGYRIWQQLPDAPEEAFSDSAGPFLVLLTGWAPAIGIVLGVFILLSTIFPKKKREA